MTGLPSNISMQIPSVPKTKGATTAVQSRVPRSAVVADPASLLHDARAFNAALHRTRDQTTAGASRQSGRALDAGRGASTRIAGCGVRGFTPASSAVVVLSLVLALLTSAPIICIGIVRLCA